MALRDESGTEESLIPSSRTFDVGKRDWIARHNPRLEERDTISGMTPRLASLIEHLEELEKELSSLGAERWVPTLNRSVALLRNGDAHGLTLWLGCYGGAGSLNDEFGVMGSETSRASELTSQTYELARQIRRDFERG